MSNGVIFRNDQNSAIISDYTSAMYFLGKANLVSTVAGSSLSNAAVSMGTTYTYNLGATAEQPLAYVSCPVGRCAILRVYKSGANYRLDLIAKGNVGTPEVYVFGVKPAYTGSEKYGMRVVKADGTDAYDSRNGKRVNLKDIKPATFIADDSALPVAYNAIFRYKGYPGYEQYSVRYGLDITSNNYETFTPCVKPAIAVNTVAICNRSTPWNYYVEVWSYDPFYGYYLEGSQRVWYLESVVYRGGFSLVSGSQVSLCWVPHVGSETYSYSTALSGGGAFGEPGGNYGSGGTPPYANQSINLTGGTMSIIDGADYD